MFVISTPKGFFKSTFTLEPTFTEDVTEATQYMWPWRAQAVIDITHWDNAKIIEIANPTM